MLAHRSAERDRSPSATGGARGDATVSGKVAIARPLRGQDRIFHLTSALAAISGAECPRGRGGGREKEVTVGRDGMEEQGTDGTDLGRRR